MYQISLNGLDGSGKTTQYNLLKKHFYYAYFSKDIGLYNVFPNLKGDDFFRWWFFESTLDEFCDSIYKGIKLRNDDSFYQNKKIVFNDKGTFTFDCRILANFLTRGYAYDDVMEHIIKYKNKYDIVEEDLSLFLELFDNSALGFRRKDRSTGIQNSYDDYYQKYQAKLFEITSEMLHHNEIKTVNANNTIDNVFADLLSSIIDNNKYFILVSGVSESGKSTAARYLNSKLPNSIHIKMKDVSNELFKNSNSRQEKYMWMREQEQNNLYSFWFDFLVLSSVYGKGNRFIIMDTLHGVVAAKEMKKILGERLSLLYIDASYRNRVSREYSKLQAEGLKCTIDEVMERTQKKDKAKEKFGLSLLKQLPYTYVLNNDNSVFDFEKSLDDFSDLILDVEEKKKCLIKK